MNLRSALLIAAALGVGTVAAGCSSTSSTQPAPTSTTAASSSAHDTTTTSMAPTSTTPPSTTTSTTEASTAAVKNLPLTASIASQLLAAGAAGANLSPQDYTGLQAGRTFVAYDPSTNTYWAGAELMPSSSSTAAQIASQDDGSYMIFRKQPGGSWTMVAETGATSEPGSHCPSVGPPPAVVKVWGWAAGTCLAPFHSS